jgi:hypothetical protein
MKERIEELLKLLAMGRLHAAAELAELLAKALEAPKKAK